MPGALAVATIVTCAIFATATGIVGAVVTLMGLLALPAMLRAGYSVQLSAGAITAGGCLGILIPPSVLLIVYGATAGVSVVKLYAGAFFPGIMLAALYVLYVIIVAKLKPHLAPPLSESERSVPLPPLSQQLSAAPPQRCWRACSARLRTPGLPRRSVAGQFFVSLLPALAIAAVLVLMYGRRDGAASGSRHDRAWCSQAAAIGAEEPLGLQEPLPEASGAAACRSLSRTVPRRAPRSAAPPAAVAAPTPPPDRLPRRPSRLPPPSDCRRRPGSGSSSRSAWPASC